MAKPNAADEPAGMERADIKRHLRFAKDEPVSVAFALGGDGKAIMQFDRRKPGRALEKQLKDAAPDSKSHRWGTALVDPNDDKTVCFTVNKAGGGLARKLIVALKGTGFNKVKIQLDDGTEVEAHEEADTEGTEGDEAKPAAAPAAAAATPAEPSPAAANQPNPAALAKDLTDLVKRMLAVIAKDPTQKAALAELATDAQASLKRGDLDQASAGIDILREAVKDGEAASAGHGGGAAQATMPNGAGPAPAAANGKAAPAANGKAAPVDGQPDLRQEGEQILALLAETVKKAMAMVSQVPGLGEIVKSVVPAVQAAIKSGQLELAMSGVQRLADAIVGGSGGAAGGAGSGDKAHHEHAAKQAPAIDKAGNVWTATRQKVMSEVQKLEKAFGTALAGHGLLDDLTKTMRTKVDGTLHHLDDRLMHALAAVNKSPDPAERAKHIEHAHKLVQHYQKHVSEDQTIKMLDSNPFHPLTIAKTVMSSLAVLQKNIH